jgi:hypothetical protein
MNQIRIRVRIDNRECEVSYPLTERQRVGYSDTSDTLYSAVKAIKDIVETLKKESNNE